MKQRRTIILLAVPILPAIILAMGCEMAMEESDADLSSLDKSEMAEIVSLTMDYEARALEGDSAVMEAEDMLADEDEVTRSYGDGYAPDYTLGDGTEVYITRELQDQGTPENPEDDRLFITREFWLEGEQIYRETLDRPVKPGADWIVWDDPEMLNDDGTYTQCGVTARYAGDASDPFMTGELEGTWSKTGDEISLVKIIRDRVHLIHMTTTVTTITIDNEGNTSKEQIRIRVSDGDEIIVHAFTYAQFEEDGILKTKIISDGGSWAVRWQEEDGWHNLFYEASGILNRERIETGSLTERVVILYIYDETGTEIIETRTMEVVFARGDNGALEVTKTLDDGRILSLSIRECGEGYKIDRDGYRYIVTVDLNLDTIVITDVQGDTIGTVIINDDGSYTVITPDGESADIIL